MRRTRCVRIAALAITAMVISSACFAQSHPEYIRLGQLSAALYKPDSGPASHVAFVLAHRTANYLNHIGCRELSARLPYALFQHEIPEQRGIGQVGGDTARRTGGGRFRAQSARHYKGHSFWTQRRRTADELLSGGCGEGVGVAFYNRTMSLEERSSAVGPPF
jgi:hypothetical protein